MGTLALAADERVAAVELSDHSLTVSLMDGRTISVPLVWYPRLVNATPEQRQHWEICGGGYGIHWPDVDEDLNTEGLLRGAPAPQAAYRLAALAVSQTRHAPAQARRPRRKRLEYRGDHP